MDELEKYTPCLHNSLQCIENIVLNGVLIVLYIIFKNYDYYNCDS